MIKNQLKPANTIVAGALSRQPDGAPVRVLALDN